MVKDLVRINRAPVLTLWATVVAERQGFSRETALTLGKAVAGLNAQSKGRALGIFKPPDRAEGKPPKKVGLGEEFWVTVCGRPVPARNTKQGIRAVVQAAPIEPDKVEHYLEQKFGPDLSRAQVAMEQLAQAFSPDELALAAYPLYERFRPSIPPGEAGWGAKGNLDLELIRSLGRRTPRIHPQITQITQTGERNHG